jgi:membrane protease YdiL (CAAX protease family)
MTGWFATFFARIAQPQTPPPWRALDVLSTLIVLLLAFFLVGPLVVLLLFGNADYQTGSALFTGWIVGGVLTLVYVWFVQRYDRDGLRTGKTTLSLPFVMLLGLGIAIALDLVGFAVAGEYVPALELANAPGYDTAAWILAFGFMLIVQPLAEELVFRGVTLPTLRTLLGPWPGFLACAVLYGVFHVLTYPPEAGIHGYAVVLPFLTGLILTAVRSYTNSTRAVVVMHLAMGLFVTLEAFVMVG